MLAIVAETASQVDSQPSERALGFSSLYAVAFEDAPSLQLELFLPGLKFPVSVALGVVRWTQGKRFGVEFIRMHESQQRILQRFVVQHCADGSTSKNSMPS
jgi:hypothetical protein